MCKDEFVIPSKLQSYVVHWYHTYLLHPGIDRTGAMICKHLYWPDIINAVRMEVSVFDSYQRTKLSNKNMVNYQISYPMEFHGLDIMGTNVIRRKVKKEDLHL